MKQLLVSFVINALKRCAKLYLGKTKPYIIGVTGSVGKTSCRLIISDTLKKLLPQEYIYTSPKNYNSDIGLSLSILGIENYEPTPQGMLSALFAGISQAISPRTKPSILVLEYGIDKPGDMDILIAIVKPDTAILTAIDLVHAQNFPDGKEGIIVEKTKLLLAAKDMIIYDNQSSYPQLAWVKISTLTFGYAQGSWDIQFDKYQMQLSWDHITTSYLYSIKNNQNKLTITTNVSWTHNIAYQSIGITLADIISHRKSHPSLRSMQALQIPIQLQPGRFTLLGSLRWDIIIDSTYNAAPGSMRAVVSEWLEIRQAFFPDYDVIAVLGEMRELGETSRNEHQAFGQRLSDKSIQYVIWVSGDSVHMTDYLIQHFKSTELTDTQNKGTKVMRTETNLQASDLVQHIITSNPQKQYLIIFKSSQGEIRLEEAIKPFIEISQWNMLPRQELYWLAKKTFAKKIYTPPITPVETAAV